MTAVKIYLTARHFRRHCCTPIFFKDVLKLDCNRQQNRVYGRGHAAYMYILWGWHRCKAVTIHISDWTCHGYPALYIHWLHTSIIFTPTAWNYIKHRIAYGGTVCCFCSEKEINHMEIHTNCDFGRMYRFVWCFLFKAIRWQYPKKQEHTGTRPHTKYHTVLCSWGNIPSGHKLSNRPLWSHIQQRLLLHRLSIHRLQSASRCDNNREEITHVQAKIKITSGWQFFVMLLFFFLRWLLLSSCWLA